jgi:hypothetical protein
MLSRLGLRPVSGIEPVASTEYEDVIRVMYCTNTQELQLRFQRLIDAMAKAIGIGSEPRSLGSNSLKPCLIDPRYQCR